MTKGLYVPEEERSLKYYNVFTVLYIIWTMHARKQITFSFQIN